MEPRATKLMIAAVPVVWLLSVAGPLVAGDLEPGIGGRIRFRAPKLAYGRLEGTIVSLDESAFTLRLADQKDLTVVQRSAVEKLEIRTREGHRTRGALIGLLVGTAIGTIATAASHGSELCDSTGVSACDVKFSAIVLGVPGALIGALAAQGARWERVATGGVATGEGVRVQVVPIVSGHRRGAAVAVSFR